MTADRIPNTPVKPVEDRQLVQASPFLTGLIGDGSWKERAPILGKEGRADGDSGPSLKDFRRDFRKILDDPEAALLTLRRLRVRTILALGKADLEDRIKPHQIRARLRALSETMVQGAWWLAEVSLREKFVHPLILERRNINPPLAICSLSRLGAGEPWYTTAPAPIFVHSRAAKFAPALTEKDFEQARGSTKEWLPAREYFNRLARRTMSFLSVPDPAGQGFGHMAEDQADHNPQILPGALVILFKAFEEHFLERKPVKERLALIRLRFLCGQERLGQAVENAARQTLVRTAEELGSRLRSCVNAWYRERSQAEGLPMIRGGLLDIERTVRLLQFKYGSKSPDLIVPSPLKALDLLCSAGFLDPDERLVLSKSYGWQWFVVNRLSLFGRRQQVDWAGLGRENEGLDYLDKLTGLGGSAEKTVKSIKSARIILTGLNRAG